VIKFRLFEEEKQMRIDTIEKLIAMLTLQQANLPTYQAEVGATAQDITDINNELALLVYLTDYADIIEANKKTVNQIKQEVFNGEESEPISPFPVFPEGNPPKPLIADCLGRAQRRNRRFKAAPGYTKEIGIALGIEEDSQKIPPESVKPTIEVFTAQTGYTFSLVVGKRGDADSWDALVLKKGASGWAIGATRTGKSGDITITPTTPGEPEQLQVRVQLKKNNANYGQPSDIVYVTVNP
jgi:hypothetical protein